MRCSVVKYDNYTSPQRGVRHTPTPKRVNAPLILQQQSGNY